jgi:hypothetical protein
MKLLNLLLITTASLSLFACNAGDDTNSDDVQQINVTGPAASGNGTYSVQGQAVNCRTTPENCHVTLSSYNSSGNLNPSVINYAISGQASSGISNICNNSNGTNQKCSFTIYGTTSTGQPVTFLFNGVGHATSTQAFVIGGGL